MYITLQISPKGGLHQYLSLYLYHYHNVAKIAHKIQSSPILKYDFFFLEFLAKDPPKCHTLL